MVYYHWLIKKLLWAYGRAEESKVRTASRDRGEENAESGKSHVASGGERREPPAGILLVNHEPQGKIQNINNGFI